MGKIKIWKFIASKLHGAWLAFKGSVHRAYHCEVCGNVSFSCAATTLKYSDETVWACLDCFREAKRYQREN